MRVPIRIDSRLRLPTGALGEECVEDLQSAFTHKNPKRAALEHMGVRGWWNEPRQIETWRGTAGGPLRGGEITLPRGGMDRVREVLSQHKLEWESEDRRSAGRDFGGRCIPEHLLELWPHQQRCVRAALERQQGVIRAPTGSGKTCVAFAIASRVQLPTIVVVDSGALHDQWVERAGTELGLQPRDVGVIRGSKVNVRPLTVAMAHALVGGVAQDLADTFGCLIFDEVQIAAAPMFLGAVDPFNCRYRIGISDDERRKDQKEFLTYDVFGPIIEQVSREEVEAAGFTLNVEVRVVPTDFRADWYGLADEDDDEDDREVDFDRLLKEMAADEARNELAARWAAEEVGRGNAVVLAAEHVEHCHALARALVSRGVSTGSLVGGPENRREFRRTKESLVKGGSVRAGVGTIKAVGKGLDVPALSRGVIVTPLAGNKQKFQQGRGRFCRAPKGKRDAVMYVLWDRYCGFGPRHLRNILAWNKRVLVWDGQGWQEGRAYARAKGYRRGRRAA